MTPKANPQSAHSPAASDSKRNFILQQGLDEPAAGTCPLQYSALLFQPRVIGLWLVVAIILQAPVMFFGLTAVLWWGGRIRRV